MKKILLVCIVVFGFCLPSKGGNLRADSTVSKATIIVDKMGEEEDDEEDDDLGDDDDYYEDDDLGDDYDDQSLWSPCPPGLAWYFEINACGAASIADIYCDICKVPKCICTDFSFCEQCGCPENNCCCDNFCLWCGGFGCSACNQPEPPEPPDPPDPPDDPPDPPDPPGPPDPPEPPEPPDDPPCEGEECTVCEKFKTVSQGEGCPMCECSLTYTIIITVNPPTGGTVNGDGSYQPNANVTITATANSGYEFVNWTGHPAIIGSIASQSFTIEEDKNLIANFRPCFTDGRANPLGHMQLAPPIRTDGSQNIPGATWGNTRTNRDGSPRFHDGIDLWGVVGTPISAQFDGVISREHPIVWQQPNRVNGQYPPGYTGDKRDGGNRITIISTVNGVRVTNSYMHLQAGNAFGINPDTGKMWAAGDTIRAAQIIGYIGITGNANPNVPHLHLQTTVNRRPADPAGFLNATVNPTTTTIITPCD